MNRQTLGGRRHKPSFPVSPKKPSDLSKTHSLPPAKNHFFALPLELRQQILLHTTQPPPYDRKWNGQGASYSEPYWASFDVKYRFSKTKYDVITRYYERQCRTLEIHTKMWRDRYLVRDSRDKMKMEECEWIYKEWARKWEAWRVWILNVRDEVEKKIERIGAKDGDDEEYYVEGKKRRELRRQVEEGHSLYRLEVPLFEDLRQHSYTRYLTDAS